ncbi:MAG TPA: MgtC/SapB family protein [Acidimicrobiales bacterium]|nr:MgtC/SapB family protein [Acidimicrobiales bacterium]
MWAATSFDLDADVVVRLLGAAVLGGLVGIEREASDQPAGLRTHIAVALGASLFGVVSTLGFLEFDQVRANSTVQVDVSRVASNVAVGIGFLGAGVIFRQGSTIRNLTTAASLWVVAAVGLACGVGDVTTAAIATVVLLGSLVLLRPIRSLIRRHWATTSTVVTVELAAGVESDEVIDLFDGSAAVETSQFRVRKEEGRMVLVSSVSGPPHDVRRWVSHLAARPEIESVSEE